MSTAPKGGIRGCKNGVYYGSWNWECGRSKKEDEGVPV